MLQDKGFLEIINSDDSNQSSRLVNTHQVINYLDDKLYRKYEPTKQPCPGFMGRMKLWLDNVDSTEHKIALYDLVLKIFFVGEEEFNSLYRVAFHEVIIPWVVDKESIEITSDDFTPKIEACMSQTWFCPISDSLRINAFYHVNHIVGRDFRPDWRSLKKFADKRKVEKFIKDSKIKRIVLLEDFVGSGGQALDIIDFLRTLDVDIDILLIPLVICPKGDSNIRDALKNDDICYRPVVRVPDSEILSFNSVGFEGRNDAVIREISEQYSSIMNVAFKVDNDERIEIGALGYRNTGALVVMYSNCPNNTISIIHRDTEEWMPLFPRSERYGS